MSKNQTKAQLTDRVATLAAGVKAAKGILAEAEIKIKAAEKKAAYFEGLHENVCDALAQERRAHAELFKALSGELATVSNLCAIASGLPDTEDSYKATLVTVHKLLRARVQFYLGSNFQIPAQKV